MQLSERLRLYRADKEFCRRALGVMLPVAVQQLIIFRHDTELGNAPSHKTLGLVSVQRKDGVDVARSFADYEVTIDRDAIPDGVTVSVRS